MIIARTDEKVRLLARGMAVPVAGSPCRCGEYSGVATNHKFTFHEVKRRAQQNDTAGSAARIGDLVTHTCSRPFQEVVRLHRRTTT